MPGQRDRHTGCVGAYLVEHDLFDFLLFSLPDNDTHSHKVGPGRPGALDRGGRPRPRADHARGRRPGGVPRGARGDRHVGPLADRRRVGDQPVRRAGGHARAQPERPGARRGRAGGLSLGAVGDGLRARRRRAATSWSGARPTRCSRPTAWSSSSPARTGARWAPRRGRAALRTRERPRRMRAGAAGRSTGDEAVLELHTGGGGWAARHTRTRWGGCGPRWRARTPATCWRQPSWATSSWTGAAPITWAAAATGRSTADDSEGVLLLCGVEAPEREQWSLSDVTPLVLEHFGVPLAG